MRRSLKVLAVTAAIGASGVGTAALVTTATGASPERPDVAALTDTPASPAPPAVEQAFDSPSMAEYRPDPGTIRAVPAPGGESGSWYVAGSADGVCLSTNDGAAACGPTSSANDGSLTLITLTAGGAAPAADGATPARPTVTGATIAGVAPDDVDSARLVGPDGRTIDVAPVESNVYRLDSDRSPEGSAIVLEDDTGADTTVPVG